MQRFVLPNHCEGHLYCIHWLDWHVLDISHFKEWVLSPL